jgi:hypothetical protein
MTDQTMEYGRKLVADARAAQERLFHGMMVSSREQEQLNNTIAKAEMWLMSHADELLAPIATEAK